MSWPKGKAQEAGENEGGEGGAEQLTLHVKAVQGKLHENFIGISRCFIWQRFYMTACHRLSLSLSMCMCLLAEK